MEDQGSPSGGTAAASVHPTQPGDIRHESRSAPIGAIGSRPWSALARIATTTAALAALLSSGCYQPELLLEDAGDVGGGPGGGDPGGGDPGDGGGPIGGTDGGIVIEPLEAGDLFAALEVVLPDTNEFTIHGTVPLPKGVFPRPDGKIPFGILDYDRTARAAQVEVVSWYPALSDGAEVVEIIAQVRRHPGYAPGSRTQYGVVAVTPQAPPPNPGSSGVEDLVQGTLSVPSSVQGLISGTNNIRIEARDCFGHLYSARVLDDTNAELKRYGAFQTQLRTYNTMLPNNPVGGTAGTLPHMFGVHAYVSTLANEEIVLLDLRVNNGGSGHDKTTPIDDPLGKVYFDALNVVVPAGWYVVQAVEDPFFGATIQSGAWWTRPMVKPLIGNDLHVMPSQGQFHRRLAIAPASKVSRARMILQSGTQAFCAKGKDVLTGNDFFSWWHPGTDRFFPQSHRLPTLDHMGLSNLRDDLQSEFTRHLSYLQTGDNNTEINPAGNYPVPFTELGWAHPYGVQYKGMVGGDEIYFYGGVRTAAARDPLGFRTLQIQYRMHEDRQPVALYNKDGRPNRLSDWLKQGNGFKYIEFKYFDHRRVGGLDVFGEDQAPTFQVNQVQATGRQPYYEADLLGFEPHDYQHLSRYIRYPMALAWLSNDALAKDALQQQAALFHISYNEHGNNSSNAAQEIGLLADIQEINADPGRGFTAGRGEGWGLACSNAAYALTRDVAWRDELREWMKVVVETFVSGQSSCNGIIQSKYSSKQFGNLYRFRQSIEQAILENAFRGMRETVFDGVSTPHVAMINSVLEGSYYGMISSMSWWPGEHAPWAHVALGPANGGQWCSHGQQLAELPMPCASSTCLSGNSGFHDDFQIGSSLAYAYEMTGDPIFLQKALAHTKKPGSLNLLQKLEVDGDKYLGNRAALIALAQSLAGQ
jgi:hypothetical protein